MSRPFLIRAARPDDAEAIAQVHHRSWEETYPGLMPPALLQRITLDHRRAQWRRMIDQPAPGTACFVAEWTRDDNDGVVGVGQCGPSRDAELGARYEINLVYVLQSAQGIGVGKALMRAMFDVIAIGNADDADQSIGLWTLQRNDRAIRFYERLGARVTGVVKLDEREGVVLNDVAMRWDKAP